MDRGGDLAAALLDHLRARLDERGLELQEPLTPISGGFDTRIFAFRLRSAAPAFAGPLILRLLGPQHDPARVLRERVTQNTLAGLGYPAPRVLLACPDPAPLGGAFLVMERLPGAPLLQARYLNLSRVLVETQLRLHALDAEALLRAMDEEGRDSLAAGGTTIGRETITIDGHFAQLEARIARGARISRGEDLSGTDRGRAHAYRTDLDASAHRGGSCTRRELFQGGDYSRTSGRRAGSTKERIRLKWNT